MQYVLVTGSREGVSPDEVANMLMDIVSMLEGDEITLVHGAAKGADRLASSWACDHGLRVEAYPARWNDHSDPTGTGVVCRCTGPTCRAAGVRRNELMVRAHDYAVCVAFPRGDARGTNDMIARMRAHGYSPVIDYGHELEL